VPGWFANLLPEGALRAQVVRDLGGGNIGDYTLLTRLGSALPGAVTVHSDDEPADDVAVVVDADPDHELRHSLAGVQLKYTVRDERLVVGNTDAHLKNWGLRYPDGRTPQLSPVYDFHSLTAYSRFQFQPLALSLNGERMPGQLDTDDLRSLAERCGVDPGRTAQTAAAVVERLRAAWVGDLREEARERFPALADHYEYRLRTLPICSI
jgi:hypothetical protein